MQIAKLQYCGEKGEVVEILGQTYIMSKYLNFIFFGVGEPLRDLFSTGKNTDRVKKKNVSGVDVQNRDYRGIMMTRDFTSMN